MGGWEHPARLPPTLLGFRESAAGSLPPDHPRISGGPGWEPVRSPILLIIGDEIDEEIMRRYFGPLGTREEGCPNLAAGVGAFSGGSLPPEKAPPLPGGSRPHFSRSRAENGWEPPARLPSARLSSEKVRVGASRPPVRGFLRVQPGSRKIANPTYYRRRN